MINCKLSADIWSIVKMFLVYIERLWTIKPISLAQNLFVLW